MIKTERLKYIAGTKTSMELPEDLKEKVRELEADMLSAYPQHAQRLEYDINVLLRGHLIIHDSEYKGLKNRYLPCVAAKRAADSYINRLEQTITVIERRTDERWGVDEEENISRFLKATDRYQEEVNEFNLYLKDKKIIGENTGWVDHDGQYLFIPVGEGIDVRNLLTLLNRERSLEEMRGILRRAKEMREQALEHRDNSQRAIDSYLQEARKECSK